MGFFFRSPPQADATYAIDLSVYTTPFGITMLVIGAILVATALIMAYFEGGNHGKRR